MARVPLPGALCAAAVAAVLYLRPAAFSAPPPQGRLAPRSLATPERAALGAARDANANAGAAASPAAAASSGLSALCGALAAAGALGLCLRGLRVAMRSQAQGGRFTLGQGHFPKLKGAKKLAVLRKRKNYGTHSAIKVPRRYELYDILEELDETTPVYTVISEPDEPMLPVEDVPLLERYPWAGSLEKVNRSKQIKEGGVDRMEPYFGDWTRGGMPPRGRTQQYVFRRGVPRYNHPPWINRPLIGEMVRVPGDMPYMKDRRPELWQYNKSQIARLPPAERKRLGLDPPEPKRVSAKTVEEVDAGLDDELDAMAGIEE